MITERQRYLQQQMRIRVSKLRKIGVSDRKMTKIIRKLNLPLGSQLNLLDTK